MTPQTVQSSLRELVSSFPEYQYLPLLSEETAGKVTFLGFSFPLNGKKASAKLYFVPERQADNLPREIPDHLRCAMNKAIALHSGAVLQLYDVSLEQAENGLFVGRLLWAIRSQERASERFSQIVHRLLAELGHPAIAVPLLRINNRLRDLLHSELNPFFLLGGFLREDGSLFRVKADFDADSCRDNDQVRYDGKRSFAATTDLLDEFGCDSALSNSILRWIDEFQQCGYFIPYWGIHAADNKLENVKIYLQKKSSDKNINSLIVNRFFSAIIQNKVGCPRLPNELLCDFGWKQNVLYLEIASGRLNSVKIYYHT